MRLRLYGRPLVVGVFGVVMIMAKTRKDDRTRNWLFVVYPESAPENWRDLIDDHHIQWIESPLHDKDIDGNGEKKKPHIHVLLLFEGPKSFEQVHEIIKDTNGSIPIKCLSSEGSTRYFAHLDNPDKYQYNPKDIIGHGGVDVAKYLAPRSSQKYALIRDMQMYIKEHDITEYGDFLDYCAENHFDDWYPLLCDSCTYVIRSYLNSRRFKKLREYGKHQQLIDPDTGELINVRTR